MFDLALRQLATFLPKLLALHESQHDRSDVPTPDVDTTWLPVKLALPSRLRERPDPILTVHVTDVTGGFGVAKSAIKRWEAIIAAGKQAPGDGAFASALLERYSGCAYHGIASRRVGAVRNHPATLRTSHGNGGNRGMGWAADMGHSEALTPALAGAGLRSLSATIVENHLATGEVVSVVPHAVWSGKRRVDTDGTVWRGIVLPTVEALGSSVCAIDWDICDRSKGGRPLRELKWAR